MIRMIYFRVIYFSILISGIFAISPKMNFMQLAIKLLHEQESALKLMKFKVDGNYFNTNNKMFENKLKQMFYEEQREVEKRLEQERRELIYKKTSSQPNSRVFF